jgi:hypothetical protein
MAWKLSVLPCLAAFIYAIHATFAGQKMFDCGGELGAGKGEGGGCGGVCRVAGLSNINARCLN